MPTQSGKQFSVFTLLSTLRRRKWLVIVPALLLSLAATGYALMQPVRWKADALLGIDNSVQGLVQGTSNDSSGVPAKVSDQLLTIREALYSRQVLEPVIREFGLYPVAMGKVSDDAVEDMKNRVKIQLESDDSFHIQFEDQDAARAMQVTNRVSQLFVQRLANVRQQQVSEVSSLLDGELNTLRTKLNDQEQRIAAYKQRAGTAVSDKVDTTLHMLQTAQMDVERNESSRANDEARLSAVREEMAGLEKNGVLQAQPARERTPDEIKLDDLKFQLKQAESKYTESHPEVVRLRMEIANLQRAVAASPVKARAPEPSVSRMRYLQLKAERQALEQRIRSYREENARLQSRMGQLQGSVVAAPQHDAEIAELTRDYETTKTRYNELLAKQQEARLQTRVQTTRSVSFKVIEPASMPQTPSTPRRSRLILMGLFASIGAGLALAFAVEQMDSSFDSIDAFQAYTNLPLITGLPTVSGSPSSAVSRNLGGIVDAASPCIEGTRERHRLGMKDLLRNRIVTLADPHSVAAEQYRILALKVQKRMHDADSPVLMVTSAIGGEGKTITSMNLAFALAASGQRRVLLIEADLRKSRMHEYLGIPEGRGFSEMLENPENDPDAYVWRIGKLNVLTGGACPQNPVDLLSAPEARRLMDRFKREYDWVVVDAPPVLPIVDAHVLAGLSDATLLVVRARYTKRELLQRAVESFQVNNVMGAVLNDVDYQHSRYAYAYEYYSKNYLSRRR